MCLIIAATRVLLAWRQRLSGVVPHSRVIVDGKQTGFGGVEMVDATDGWAQYLGWVMTAARSNEIPAARLAGAAPTAQTAHPERPSREMFLVKSARPD